MDNSYLFSFSGGKDKDYFNTRNEKREKSDWRRGKEAKALGSKRFDECARCPGLTASLAFQTVVYLNGANCI